MKRTIALLVFAGCMPHRPGGDASRFDSVRDRLEAEPTAMFVGATLDAGTLAAEHRTDTGWQGGSASLSIRTGELAVALDTKGALMVSALDLSFDPIDIPPSVFGTPAQLTNVRLQLPTPTAMPVTWRDADDASATLPLELSLSWSLAVNGGVIPLSAQALPPIPFDVSIGGDGDAVTAAFDLHAQGELWSWADLLELTGLDVSADAATTVE